MQLSMRHSVQGWKMHLTQKAGHISWSVQKTSQDTTYREVLCTSLVSTAQTMLTEVKLRYVFQSVYLNHRCNKFLYTSNFAKEYVSLLICLLYEQWFSFVCGNWFSHIPKEAAFLDLPSKKDTCRKSWLKHLLHPHGELDRIYSWAIINRKWNMFLVGTLKAIVSNAA